MNRKRSIISLLLIFVIVAGCFVFVPPEKVEAATAYPGKDASFFTYMISKPSDRIKVTASLNQWFNTWKDGNRYPFRGIEYEDRSPYGAAQCWAYADNLLRAIVDDNLVDGENIEHVYLTSVKFNRDNFKKYFMDTPPGTHLRIKDRHSISLLRVGEETVKGKKEIYVYWTDCNWDHKNTIGYYRDTLDGFLNTYINNYYYTQLYISFYKKPKTYASTHNPARHYTLKFDANGGTGSIKSMKLQYGVRFNYPINSFKREGAKFLGWNLYRSSDSKWLYVDSDGRRDHWFKEGSQYNGYTKKLIKSGESDFAEGSYVDKDTVTAYSVWEHVQLPTKVWTRLSGGNRYSTMKSIIDTGFTKTGGTVILSSGETYKDALSASALAGLSNSPIVLTEKDRLNETTIAVLKRLKPKKVIVTGGTAAISEGVFDEVKKVTGVEPNRVYGTNAAETSAKLALEGKGKWKGGLAFISTTSNYKDALSAAPISYALGYPILLAQNGTDVTEPVLSALKTLGIKNVIILGGTMAVSSNVDSQLVNAGIKIKKRLAGSNAIATSRMIGEWGLSKGMLMNNVGIASSLNFPDALAGATLCGKNKAVILLADDSNNSNADFIKSKKAYIKRGYVFGGAAAVGLETFNKLTIATR